MARELTKREIGSLQEAMVQIIQMTGKRPTILLVHPIIQHELGLSLSLFAMEHNLTIEIEPRLLPPTMAFKNPRQEQREPWRG